MTYHIATDEQIKKALKKILTKYRTVHSQIMLHNLVVKELTSKKEKFGVSGARLRSIAINSDAKSTSPLCSG